MKPRLELESERNVKGNKKTFCCCVGGQRLNKGNVQLWGKRVAGLCQLPGPSPQGAE